MKKEPLNGFFLNGGNDERICGGDSEQMEQTATVLLLRNSGSVEQIQDRREEPCKVIQGLIICNT